MKITMYELLGMVKDEPDKSVYVKYFDRANKKEDVIWACKENIIYKLNQLITDLNDEAEIIEEENKTLEKISWKPKESMAGELTQKEQIEVMARRTEKLKKSINEIIEKLNDLESEVN